VVISTRSGRYRSACGTGPLKKSFSQIEVLRLLQPIILAVLVVSGRDLRKADLPRVHLTTGHWEEKLARSAPNRHYAGKIAVDTRKVGIADGGHTFAVISDIMERLDRLKALTDWTEPYVRVRFLTSKAAYVVPEEMVEALNTSTQVKEYTMDEYRNEFQPLKNILTASGFDISNISFRENDAGIWDVREIAATLPGTLSPSRWW
jgi:hypothetical protein